MTTMMEAVPEEEVEEDVTLHVRTDAEPTVHRYAGPQRSIPLPCAKVHARVPAIHADLFVPEVPNNLP